MIVGILAVRGNVFRGTCVESSTLGNTDSSLCTFGEYGHRMNPVLPGSLNETSCKRILDSVASAGFRRPLRFRAGTLVAAHAQAWKRRTASAQGREVKA